MSQNIETYIVKVNDKTHQKGVQVMASSNLHVFHMAEPVPIGQPSLKEAVCWSK